MKTTLLSILVTCLITISALGQPKPQKTFNHEKFANKVYGNFSAGMDPTIFLPDDDALQYISTKTGRSMDELKKEREDNKIYLTEDKLKLAGENVGGQMVMKVELVKVEHPTLEMGNIIVQVAAAGKVKRIELGNCIQTDVTWVLGNYMGLEGQRPKREKILTGQEEMDLVMNTKNKEYASINGHDWDVMELILVNDENKTGKKILGKNLMASSYYWFNVKIDAAGKCKGSLYKGDKEVVNLGDHYQLNKETGAFDFINGTKPTYQFKLHSVDQHNLVLTATIENTLYYFMAIPMEAEEPTPAATTNPNIKTKELKRYTAQYQTTGTDPASAYMNPDLFNKPVRGYYVTKDGKRTEAVIKYQDPSNMHSGKSTLLIYNIAYNEAGFNEDESNNFKMIVMKSDLQAFAVAGYLYVPTGGSPGGDWGILLNEGAIRESAFLGPLKKDDKITGYLVNNILHKRSGEGANVATMGILFKDQMSKLVADNTELAEKVKTKQEGYKFMQYQNIIAEYNDWYEENHAGATPYFYQE